ncbi:alpha/beta hydrolase [Alkalihalophilus pseudofirmus]|uniref:alpha/beta fold hydrolase n=1 Tax=Alkalihalophilus pseudofirmus TaxID=79885 RepID=UPI000952B41C|nr:alpha/beta hydrolase [Alkalihalophilus pseudofirmus]
MILHTTICGEGVPLLLLHSGGMTGETEYDEQSAYFSQHNYKVIRPDLRGHGKSGRLSGDYFDYCAEDIIETLNYLEIKSCHVAGVSLGGLTALIFANQFPERVRSLTFTGIFPEKKQNWEDQLKEEEENLTSLSNDPEAVSYLNTIHVNNDWRALFKSWTAPNWYPFHETSNAASLACPTLCIAGDGLSDEIEAAITFRKLNSSIQLAIIPFANHLVHREQPSLYTETLNLFLQEVDNRSKRQSR